MTMSMNGKAPANFGFAGLFLLIAVSFLNDKIAVTRSAGS